jgi:hypothetical protein
LRHGGCQQQQNAEDRSEACGTMNGDGVLNSEASDGRRMACDRAVHEVSCGDTPSGASGMGANHSREAGILVAGALTRRKIELCLVERAGAASVVVAPAASAGRLTLLFGSA